MITKDLFLTKTLSPYKRRILRDHGIPVRVIPGAGIPISLPQGPIRQGFPKWNVVVEASDSEHPSRGPAYLPW
jgi:hypothetical protein